MNKTIIIVLAVCLISAQAFVKRDAPADKPKSDLDDLVNKIKEGTKDLGDKISEAFKPDNIKKNIESISESFSKTIEGFKPKEEPKA